MSLYEGGLFKVSRKLDGKGRLQLPGDFREAVGFALDEEVEIAAVMLKDSKKAALMITRKEGNTKWQVTKRTWNDMKLWKAGKN